MDTRHARTIVDGTAASYLLPVSLRGGIVMVALAALYVGVLYMVANRRAERAIPHTFFD